MKQWLKQLSMLVLLYAFKMVKISFVIGSHVSFFSARTFIFPLSGALFGMQATIINVLCSLVWASVKGTALLASLVHIVPGLCAAYAFTRPRKITHLILPLMCMTLFLMHPASSNAWLYAALWVIPIIGYFFADRYLGARSVCSTFIAHAVGSVIWQYTMPMSSAVWLAMIPLVIVERAVMALGMSVTYATSMYLRTQAWPVMTRAIKQVWSCA